MVSGRAVAELIFGDYSPSGKLPVTFYEDETELPEFTDYSMSNRTYRYSKARALYPFGYGLKYTDIEYSGETLDRSCASVGDEITISAQVSNNGTYDVNEIFRHILSMWMRLTMSRASSSREYRY